MALNDRSVPLEAGFSVGAAVDVVVGAVVGVFAGRAVGAAVFEIAAAGRGMGEGAGCAVAFSTSSKSVFTVPNVVATDAENESGSTVSMAVRNRAASRPKAPVPAK